ncbi:histidine phosphatase family protein [Nitrosomonas communis]|uniref:phosphoglycerate mutase (2,3-diphosphoglycerate-dependent) n=1 Tax=Nitrosomonas communis TaxID=44574 RepID=A0A1I4M3U6_9PROT|nr:histidine phosphatase family protein [Nitrosomonas communis]SFL98038.1 alpha-ribazole phosphatase [Nitrosomonas communis]
MTTVAYIDLLRHGDTGNGGRFCGSTDHVLTEVGWQQMWGSVEQAPRQWQHIITSPLKRCAHFAQMLAERYTIPLTQDARLQEIHFGEWEGCTPVELMQTDAEALVRFWQNPLDNPPPQAEHLLDFKARVLGAWQDVHTQFANQNILLITHSGVMRILLCHLRQQSLQQLLNFDVPYAAMQTVEAKWHENGCRLTLKSDQPE